MNPDRVEFNLGSTIYGQPLRLVWAHATGGRREWILCRDEADQRDDRVFIAGLTGDTILKMAEAVKSTK